MVSSVSLVRKRDDKFGHRYCVACQGDSAGKTLLVFIHGAAGSAAYFREPMTYFAERGFVCVAPDIMGHGERAGDDVRGAHVSDYVVDMRGFMSHIVRAAYPKQKIVLVGHSMGGLIVQKLAEDGMGHAIVLITPAPPKGIAYFPSKLVFPAFSDIGGILALMFARKPFTPSRKMISSFFADPVASERVIDAWCATPTFGESLIVLRELGISATSVDRGRISAPMLVVGATEDVVIHPRVAKQVATYFGADHEEIPHLGHMCIFEAGWEATAQVIGGWLSKKC